MNADAQAQLATDLANLATWNGGDTLTWKGQTLAVVSASRQELRSDPGTAGFWDGYTGRLLVRLREFQTLVGGAYVTGTLPAQGETVTFRGKARKILSVTVDDGNPLVTIKLESGERPI